MHYGEPCKTVPDASEKLHDEAYPDSPAMSRPMLNLFLPLRNAAGAGFLLSGLLCLVARGQSGPGSRSAALWLPLTASHGLSLWPNCCH